MISLFQKLIRQRYILTLSLLLWLSAIIILSSIPYDSEKGLPESSSGFRWDYLEHFGVFFVLGFLACLKWMNKSYRIPLVVMIILIITGLCLSYILEYSQLYVPGRTFNEVDILFNMLGLISGFLIIYYTVGHMLRSSLIKQ